MNDSMKQYADSLKAMQAEINNARNVCQSLREVDQDINNLRHKVAMLIKGKSLESYEPLN